MPGRKTSEDENFQGDVLSYPEKFDASYGPPKAVQFVADYSFIEGEVFFVSPQGWKGISEFGSSPKNHPGCVVIQQRRPRRPVTMVPGTSQPRQNQDNFFPEFPLWRTTNRGDNKSDSAFLYLYATPVSRHDIVNFLGAMEKRDIARLLDWISGHYGPRWRNQHG